ncbi:unnamed protein product [Somion occarium]|uniref:Deacetylase sirtuin-type domain-containing protein n=1 Tax=Somion occarium TaxID=3059160 RepID=A0ABP1E1W4_9APHY
MQEDLCHGVSTTAGIPDFRSPETGLYANLARLDLPYPEAVFEINFFRSNPVPFYALARELLPGHFRPTPTHSFVRLLADHGVLGICFTQNIDTLERLAGVPPNRIVEAHGSFATQHCIECGASYDNEKLRQHIKAGTVAYCERCHGLVKPDIVFFGEAMPMAFHRSIPLLQTADLLLVMGTSLTVHPFASLASMVPDRCPRVLMNLDAVGDFGCRSDDVICLGKTDDIVRDLCKELGWEEELNIAWKKTETVVGEFGPPSAVAIPEVKEGEKGPTEEELLEAEVSFLTHEVERALHIGAVPPEETPEERQMHARPQAVDQGRAASPILVQVGDAHSARGKATYIIGGLDGPDTDTSAKVDMVPSSEQTPSGASGESSSSALQTSRDEQNKSEKKSVDRKM